MNRDDIHEALEESRIKVLELISALPEDSLAEGELENGWTVKDLLAHLTAWESEMVTGLMQVDRGITPQKLLGYFKDIDGFNARTHEENRERDWELVFDDFRGVRLQMEEWIPEFTDEQLFTPRHFPWAGEQSLVDLIKANSFGHEGEHMDQLTALVERLSG